MLKKSVLPQNFIHLRRSGFRCPKLQLIFSEKGLEEYVEERLLKGGYLKGNPADYNREYAIDTKMLFDFLENTQPKKMQKFKDVIKTNIRLKSYTA